MSIAIRFENVSKQYRLGEVGTGTLSHDLHRAWAKLRGQPDPFATVGSVNNREQSGELYVWALRDISFDVMQGEIVGLIGRNGAGKSTLLKLLSRITAPTRGRIKTKGRIASLLEVGTGFHPELTGRENVYLNGAILGMRRYEIQMQLDEIIDFSGCAKYIDTPVKRYSSGMMVRLGFAVAAHLRCEILIVDEVLAVGDIEFQKRCLDKLDEVAHSHGRTILFVSHNMGAISQICSECILIERGQLSFRGPTEAVISKYLDHGCADQVRLPINEATRGSFLAIATEDMHGQLSSVFRFQHPVCIRIEFLLRDEIPGLEIGINVYSRSGTLIFCSERSQTDNTQLAIGENILHVAIPAQFLTPGTYKASAVAHVPNQEIIDLHENAIAFQIEETGSSFSRYHGRNVGLVLCTCDWRTLNPH